VIVVPNMFGDIITDLGAAIAGGMGIASSGNLNPDGTGPSMFEPVHGSAPDIAGENKANPIAAIDSMGLLCREVGRIKNDDAAVKAGELIGAAVQKVTPKFGLWLRRDRTDGDRRALTNEKRKSDARGVFRGNK